ncbi:hypothetical protein C2E31_14495 [Rhodopirellula baltica]|nr:hypothetical protein C2E31_14495 [Rhodopirellula baltica]
MTELIFEDGKRTYTYFPSGYVKSVIDANGFETEYTRDAMNRITSETKRGLAEAPEVTRTYEYDAHGNQTQSVDGDDVTTTTQWDILDRQKTRIEAVGELDLTTEYAYALGQFDIGYGVAGQAGGDVHLIKQPDGSVIATVYNEYNEPIASYDTLGRKTTYVIDDAGRTTSVVLHHGGVITNTLDGRGRVTAESGPLPDMRTETVYDHADRVLQTTIYNSTENQTTKYLYNLFNQVALMTNAEGQQTRHEYDVSGNKIATVLAPNTANEFRSEFTYDSRNRLESETNGAAQPATFTYYPEGQLKTSTDERGHTTTNIIDQFGRVVESIDPEGGVTKTTYSGEGNILQVDDARDTTDVFRFEYDGAKRLIREIDPDGRTTTYEYDEVGRKTKVTDPRNSLANGSDYTTETKYDVMGRVTEVIDPEGNKTSYTYDKYDAVATITRPIPGQDQGLSGDTYVVTNTWSSDRRRQTTTIPLSNDIGDDRKVELIQVFDTLGNKLSERKPGTNVYTQWQYDKLNRMVAQIDGAGSETPATTQREYNEVGKIETFTDAKGTITRYEYDDRLFLSETIQAFGTGSAISVTTLYDDVGNLVLQSDPRPTIAPTQFVYDKLDRLIERIQPSGDGLASVVFEYDGVGNIVKEYDARDPNWFTTYAFDSAGRLESKTDAQGHTWFYGYDDANNQTSVTNPQGETKVFHYDGLNRQIGTSDAMGHTMCTVYDAAGNVVAEIMPNAGLSFCTGISIADAEGLTHTKVMQYDNANRMIALTDAEGNTTRYGYDAASRKTSIVDPRAGANPALWTTTLQYDSRGNLIEVVRPSGMEGNDETLTTAYQYDLNDNLLVETDPRGVSTRYDYDVLNRRIAIHQETAVPLADDGTGQFDGFGVLRTRFDFDEAGNVIHSYDPRGSFFDSSSTYDGANNLTSRTNNTGTPSAPGPVATWVYSYDKNNNEIASQDPRGQYYTTYTTYDELNRVVQVDRPRGIPSEPLAPSTEKYIYDNVGRLIVTEGPRAGLDGQVLRMTYDYDPAGRQISRIDPAGHETQYVYDANGNVIEERYAADAYAAERIIRHSFDENDRLTSTTNAEGYTIELEYDAVNNKTATVGPLLDSDGNTIRFESVYDAANRVRVATDAEHNSTTYKYDGSGNVIAITDARGDYYTTETIYDGIGRVVQTSVPTGTELNPGPAAVTQYRYDNAGQIATEIDPRGPAYATVYTYTVDEQIGSVDRFSGRTVSDNDRELEQWTYDAAGYLASYIDSRGAGFEDQFVFDASGLLIESSTLGGTELNPKRLFKKSAYDESGNLIWEQDFGGEDYVTRFEYDDLNYPAAIIDAVGDEIRYTADRYGNLVVATDKFGTSRRTYDSMDRETSLTNGEGDVSRTFYPDTNTTMTKDGRGNETTTTFDGMGRILTVTDPFGDRTEYTYDEVANLVRLVDAVGNVHETTFDARSLPLVQTVGVGSDSESKVTFEYDLLGRLIRQTDPRDPTGQFFASTTHYDGLGRVTEVHRSAATPDFSIDVPVTPGFSDLVTQLFYDEVGNVVREVPEGGDDYAIDYVYNLSNQPTEVSRDTGTTAASRISVTQMDYNDNGDLVELIDALGHRTTYQYDAVGRRTLRTIESSEVGGDMVQSWNYVTTANGPTIAITDATGVVAQVMHFDKAGRQSKIETVGEPDRVLTYDASGNLKSETVGNWSESHQYDARNHLSQTTDGDGNTVRYEFDAIGNLRFFFEADGAEPTEYRYNARNETIEVIDPVGNATQYEYDPAGNLIGLTDAGGEVTAYQYDGEGRLIAETNRFGTKSYTLDAQGERVAMVDRDGRRSTFQHTFAGDLVTESWFDPSGTQVGAIDFQVDALGRVTRIDSDGTTVDLELSNDASDRLIHQTLVIENQSFQLAHTPDQLGRGTETAVSLVGQDEPFVVNQYVFNPATHQLERVEQSGSFVSEKSIELTDATDLANVYSAITRRSNGNDDIVTTIGRNNRGLTESMIHDAGGVTLESFQYAYYADGQLATATDSNGLVSYGYDDANRLIGVQYDTTALDNEGYVYDEAGNRLDDGFVVGDGNRLDSNGDLLLGYDNEGNLISVTDESTGQAKELHWDHRNRLTRVAMKDSDGNPIWQLDLLYDGLDRRVKQTLQVAEPGQPLAVSEERLFVYDGADLIAEVLVDTNDIATVDVVYLSESETDSVHAQDFGGGDFSWLLHDRQKSTRLIVDPQASMIDKMIYGAYGVMLSQQANGPQSRFLYTGGEFVPELDLYYSRARFYDPSTGRFLSADPSGFLGGDANLYRYAGSDPVNMVDPSGLKAVPVGSSSVTSDVAASHSGRVARVWGSGVANPLGNGARQFQLSIDQNTSNINAAIAKDLKPVIELTGFYASLAVGVFTSPETLKSLSIENVYQAGYKTLNQLGAYTNSQSKTIASHLSAISADSRMMSQQYDQLVNADPFSDWGIIAKNRLMFWSAVSAATFLTVADELLDVGAMFADAAVVSMEGYGLPSERAQRERYSKVAMALEQQGALAVAKAAIDAIVDLPNQFFSDDATVRAQALTTIGEFIAAPAAKAASSAIVRTGGRVLRKLGGRRPGVGNIESLLKGITNPTALYDELIAAVRKDSLDFEGLKYKLRDKDYNFDKVEKEVNDFFNLPSTKERLKGLTAAEIERLKDISKTIESSRFIKEPIAPNYYEVIKPDAPGPEDYLFHETDGLAKRMLDFKDPDVQGKIGQTSAVAKKLEKLASSSLDPRLAKFSKSLSEFMGHKGRIGLPNVWNKLDNVMHEAIDSVKPGTGSVTDKLNRLSRKEAAEVIRIIDEKSVRNPVMTEITAQFAFSEQGKALGINGVFERGSFGASIDQFLFRADWVTNIVTGKSTPFSVLQGERYAYAWRIVSDLFKTPLGPLSDFDLNFTTATLEQYEKLIAKQKEKVFDKDKINPETGELGVVKEKDIVGADAINKFYEFAKNELDERIARAISNNDAALTTELKSLRESFDTYENSHRKYELVELYKQDVDEFRELVRDGFDAGHPVKKGAHGYIATDARKYLFSYSTQLETALGDGVLRRLYERINPYQSVVQRVQITGSAFVGTSEFLVLDRNFNVPAPLQVSKALEVVASTVYSPLHLPAEFDGTFDHINVCTIPSSDEDLDVKVDELGLQAMQTWIDAINVVPNVAIQFGFDDLAGEALANTRILRRDELGRPAEATIMVDADAAGLGWSASGYDLQSVLLHEVGHAFGFDATTPGFAYFVDSDEQGIVYHLSDRELRLERNGNELDSDFHSDAVMSGRIDPAVVKSLTESDVLPVAAIWNLDQQNRGSRSTNTAQTVRRGDVTLARSVSSAEPEFVDLPITDPTVVNARLHNVAFTQTDPLADDFAWSTIGTTMIQAGSVTLQEGTSMLSSLSQAFVVPAGKNTLSFTISGLQLDSGVNSGSPMHPPEVFEVGLLSSSTGTSQLGLIDSIAGGDAILNIQADGTLRFAEGVSIEGNKRSGSVIDFSQPFDVFVSLPDSISGQTTTLSFDLAGFGVDASQVQVSDIRLDSTNGWQNPVDKYDVNDSQTVSPIDALTVINQLAVGSVFDRSTRRFVEITDAVGPPSFYDVNGDGFASALDALWVINQLARQQAAEPEFVDQAIADWDYELDFDEAQ